MWDKIIGQNNVIEKLINIRNSGKIAHSYIFYGIDGVGKDAVAIEFAKLINCSKPVNNNACDECPSCRQISTLSSTDFKFITALPVGKNESESNDDPIQNLKEDDYKIYLSELKEKSENNYYKINQQNANNIRISSIRQIKREIYLTNTKDKKKIFIISDADKMNLQSSNSLLKILEEPPGNSLIILTTSRINYLLPTIFGRCQKIKFDSLSINDVKNYILKVSNYSEYEALFYAGLAEGSISRCDEILKEDYLSLRETVIDLLRAIVSDKKIIISAEIKKIIGVKSKERVKQSLKIMNIWLRDAFYLKNGLEEKIINKDKIESLDKFYKSFKFDSYKIITSSEDLLKEIDINQSLELLMYRKVFEIRDLIKPHSA
jgi:DNA polymerase-3 subunit delta'